MTDLPQKMCPRCGVLTETLARRCKCGCPYPESTGWTVPVLEEMATTCGHEDSTVYFHGRCHPEEPTWSYYERGTGTLTIECAVCRRTIAKIKVSHD